jgi:hypothetical protein
MADTAPDYVHTQLVARAFSLKPPQYTQHQLELLRRVVYLREQKKLTFKGIAPQLAAGGHQSARSKPLSAELVLST